MDDAGAMQVRAPAERTVDFDVFFPPGVEQDYFAAWLALRRPGGPKIVWTTCNGGHWIAVDGQTIRELWADGTRLSNAVLAVTPGLGEVMRFIPLQQDAPEHTLFRKPITRGFAFPYIVAREPIVIETARELIAGLLPQGGCDFVAEFAEILPLNVFLGLIDVPLEDRPMLREFGKQLTRPDGAMTVEGLAKAADDYLAPFVEDRLGRPGGDLFSRILSEPVDGRPWTLDEARRMCRNLLFGGLDTVAATMGMVALHLARNPADQARLRDEPDLIPTAVDELMRRYPTVSVSRNVVEDIALDGVTLKLGDIVYLPSVLHNLDPDCFDDPERVDFARRLNPLQHTTLGAGPHRCVGAGLARMEVIVFLREWLAAVPPFRLDDSQAVTMRGGNVGACTALPVRWAA